MSEYLLFIPLTFIFISLIYWTLALGIGPTPSSARVINAISKCLPETIDGDVIELGCGWGHLLPSLKNRYPENPLIGYERSPVPCHYSRWRLRQMSIRNEDLFQADVSKAGLLVCYLYPGAMDRIAKEIVPNLPAGCWLLSHTFILPGHEPVKTVKANDLYKTPVFLYRTPDTRTSG